MSRRDVKGRAHTRAAEKVPDWVWYGDMTRRDKGGCTGKRTHDALPPTGATRRAFPTAASPTPSVVSSATVRPETPGIDRDALNCIRDMLDAVKAQTNALRDGQLLPNDVLDELRQRCPMLQDNTELVERLQRFEDLINRLADS